jgi:ribosomal protein L37AE/L43A
MIGFSDEGFAAILGAEERSAIRRVRVCKHAPGCPKCHTQQVQIIDCRPLATWKCRHCKHTWRHEPLIRLTKQRDELVKYAKHLDGCGNGWDCWCGLYKAIASVKGTEK